MGEIHVQFNSLESGAQAINNVYSRLTGTLEQLESDLKPMISTWNGGAQEAYLACKKQWDDAALALSQVLNSIGKAVQEAHSNYTSAENAATSNWA